MFTRAVSSFVLLVALVTASIAQEATPAKPVELEVLSGSIGTWDAEIEVWPEGLDSPSIKFKGVEANRAYGEHWFASDFDSEFMGQKMKVHSVVGFDLAKGKLVGTVVDHGPYAATMEGTYDPEKKAVTWETKAKTPAGTPMFQRTVVTQVSDDVRELEMKMPAGDDGVFKKFMRIRYTRQK